MTTFRRLFALNAGVALLASLLLTVGVSPVLATAPTQVTIGWAQCRSDVTSATYVKVGNNFICADAD